MRLTIRLTLIVLTIAVCTIGIWRTVHEPATFAVRLRPAIPLTTAACISQARRFGYSPEGGSSICAAGRGRIWYHAVITNSGHGAYPACSARAFGPHGSAVFNGPLAFTLGGIPGLFVPGHRSMTFYWYLPRRTHGQIVRYSATCSVNSNPPT
jgi:hypothetical protein